MSQPELPQPPHPQQHQLPNQIVHPPPHYHFQPNSQTLHQHHHHINHNPDHPAPSSAYLPHPSFHHNPHQPPPHLSYPTFHPQPNYYHPHPGFTSIHAQIQYEAAQFLAHQQQHHPHHFQPIFIPAETYESMGSPLQVISEPGTALGVPLSLPPTRTSSLGHHSRHTSISTTSTALTTPSAASTASWNPKQATSKLKPKQKKGKIAPVRARQPHSRVSSITSNKPAATPLTSQSTGSHSTTHPHPSPSEERDEDDPAACINAKNVKYPLLPAPPGTTYSVNNLVILIPENYSPPGTDILPSVFEQYTCRLCRKTYTGKNARSVARRHLQDKHAVSLVLQERRSRWDRGDNGFERPKDEEEKQDRNRANKAGWAKKHREAERERIQDAIHKGNHIVPKRYTKGKKPLGNGPRQNGMNRQSTWFPAVDGSGSYPGSFSSASSSSHANAITGLGLYTDQGRDVVGRMMAKTGAVQEDIQALLKQANFGITGPCATTPPAQTEAAYAPTERTDSPLSSSPDIAKLSAHQTWVQPADWDQMDWSQMTSAEPGGSVQAIPEEASPAPSSGSKTAVAELAAESLLNLHSSPARSSASDQKRVRPTPLRGFTLGSSSCSVIPSSSTLVNDSVSGWQGHTQMLDTPISLRPVIKKRTQSQQNIELGQGYTRGKLGAGERSLSFSAIVGADDPFILSPAMGKENEQQGGIARGWKVVKEEGQDGSPVPSYKKRQPLNILPVQPNAQIGFSQYAQPPPFSHHPHSHILRSSSALSSTLVPPNPIYQNPTSGSPIKRPLSATGVSFDTPQTRRLLTGTGGSSKPHWPASAVFTPFGKTPATAGKGGGWMLSSPANDGIAAELGLVGLYGYLGGLETPMRGVVGAETPVRE